ncbi:MAG: TlpA disulfide reductase family protein [Flavobacteriaceae bacterium]
MKTQLAIIIVLVSFLFSCESKHSSEYASLSGLIADNNATEVIVSSRGFSKKIPILNDGTFSDTLKVKKAGYHNFYDGKNKTIIYLKNGSDISLNYSYSSFDKSLNFSGQGSETSTYILKKKKFDKVEKMNKIKDFFKMDETAFNVKVAHLEKSFSTMLAPNGIDSALKADETNKNKRLIDYLKTNYSKQRHLLTALGKGKPSPKFFNYENIKGGTKSLDDYKGKYVYVDVWATWCGPCTREIPYLQKLEHEFKGKNISFVSISVDGARRHGSLENANKKWKSMVKSKNMTGEQLFADKAFASDFIKKYTINSIPRFLLIDPQGNIVNSNAPRPSNPQLKSLLTSLGV